MDHMWRTLIDLQSISTDDMIADLFTKQLSIQKFERHRESIRLVLVARNLKPLQKEVESCNMLRFPPQECLLISIHL